MRFRHRRHKSHSADFETACYNKTRVQKIHDRSIERSVRRIPIRRARGHRRNGDRCRYSLAVKSRNNQLRAHVRRIGLGRENQTYLYITRLVRNKFHARVANNDRAGRTRGRNKYRNVDFLFQKTGGDKKRGRRGRIRSRHRHIGRRLLGLRLGDSLVTYRNHLYLGSGKHAAAWRH